MSRIAVFAYSEVGYRCLEALIAAEADVAWVVTHTDDPRESRWYRSVAELARSRGLALTEYESMSAVLRIGRSRDQFLELVDEALREEGMELMKARQDAVRDGTWDARAEWVSDLIEGALGEKESVG